MSERAIPPALTPEQWKTVRSLEEDCASLDAVTFLEVALGTEPAPHAAAAALLYDCPFGVTGEMAAALGRVLDWAERASQGAGAGEELRESVALARQAEARLRALLPHADDA